MGSYDDLDDEGYDSSYSDVYATASSNPTVESSSDSQRAASSTNDRSILPTLSGRRQRANMNPGWAVTNQTPSMINGFSANDNSLPPQWYLNQQPNLGTRTFDPLITGVDQSSSPSQPTGANEEGLAGAGRASERHTLTPLRRVDAITGQLTTFNNTPTVPTSTTTPAPDFIMINPMAANSA